MSIAYLDGDDLATIRDRDNKGRDLLVDETNEGNNGFQVGLSIMIFCQIPALTEVPRILPFSLIFGVTLNCSSSMAWRKYCTASQSDPFTVPLPEKP